MENVSNISSEEELLQLRNEGKISENEYEELRETLQKTTKVDIGEGRKDNLKPTRTSGLAIASLVLSLVIPIGCIPAIVCGHIALRKIEKDAMLQGRGLALAGLIIGYVVLGLFIVPIMLWVSYEGRGGDVPIEVIELKSFPLNNKEELKAIFIIDAYTGTEMTIDKQISSDGNGSLRIEAPHTTAVSIFDTGNIDVEKARLICQARLRTENVKGRVYISMECSLPRGEHYCSEAQVPLLTGTTDWTTQETSFLLKKGEKPDNVSLGLIINGEGTVWIDDIRLLKGPPQ
jgi:hypothetical protein